MHKIVVFGAGKSSIYLIKRLQDSSNELGLKITLVDRSFEQLPNDCLGQKNTDYLNTPIEQKETISALIAHQDLVVSMLPAHLHICIAELCLTHSKNLVTASYVQPEIKVLDVEVRKKGLLFLNEMGVDPGLDHMSAMELIDQLKLKGAVIKNFESHTGGLIADPKPDAWNYRFTWNPKNVITAGSEGAIHIENGKERVIYYSSIFKSVTPIFVDNNLYDSYPNRNCSAYKDKYQLNSIENLYRGTLRHEGYCLAWDYFVQLGMTEDTEIITFSETATRQDFFSFFIKKNKSKNSDIYHFLKDNPSHSVSKKMNSLHLLSGNKRLRVHKATAANILLDILSEDWKMSPQDNDLLVMQHKIDYTINGESFSSTRELSVIGENRYYTAMSKTVGLPMYEAILLILDKKISLTGVQIPTVASIYTPILQKLSNSGIVFKDHTIAIT